MNILLLAPPAAGKGTQAARLKEKYQMKHISTGDLLREATKKEDDLGRYIKDLISKGSLVDDEIILEVISKELDGTPIILDGFPRSLKQAKSCSDYLEKLNQKIDAVIYLEVPYETLKARIVGRASCPKCKKVYNTMIEDLKPQNEGICDDCGEILQHREDDNEETFKKRYDTYISETEPLVEYYEKQGVLKRIDATILPDEVFKKIEEAICDFH